MPFLKKAPACQSETGLTLDGCHERPEAETRPRSPLKCVVKKPRAGIIKRGSHADGTTQGLSGSRERKNGPRYEPVEVLQSGHFWRQVAEVMSRPPRSSFSV